jgi:hypothetical protein
VRTRVHRRRSSGLDRQDGAKWEGAYQLTRWSSSCSGRGLLRANASRSHVSKSPRSRHREPCAGGDCGTAGSIRRARRDTYGDAGAGAVPRPPAGQGTPGCEGERRCPSGPGLGRESTARSPAQAKRRILGRARQRHSLGDDRTGTIAEQSLEPLSIAGLDADRGVEREAAPAPALAPLGRGLGREHAPPLEQAQYPLSHGVLYSRWPTAVASRNLTPSAWALNGTAVGAARRSPTNTGTAASNTPSIMAQWKCRLALRYTASSASQRFMNRITVTPGTR